MSSLQISDMNIMDTKYRHALETTPSRSKNNVLCGAPVKGRGQTAGHDAHAFVVQSFKHKNIRVYK